MDGWRELENASIFIKGTQLVVVGHPGEEEKIEHNCDEMGCGSVDHVIIRGFISKHGCREKDLEGVVKLVMDAVDVMGYQDHRDRMI